MIRDWLVVGIRDSSLSERLQLDANLTLEKAKTAIRQKEAVQEQQGILKGDSKSNPITLDAVKAAHKAVPLCRLQITNRPDRLQQSGHRNYVADVEEDPTNENSAQPRMPPAINVIVKDILVPSVFLGQFLQ